jgi:hypothetical protein
MVGHVKSGCVDAWQRTQVLELSGIQIGSKNFRALAIEQLGGGTTDALPSRGNKRFLAVQPLRQFRLAL